MSYGKVVLITGASTGIGLATAQHLAKEGYTVYASCRNPEKSEALKKLSNEIDLIKIIKLDVDSDDSVNKAIAEIFKNEASIDVVINNAGFGIYGPAEMHTSDEIQKVFNTNVFGVCRVNSAVIPHMRKQRSGRIINIGSVSGCKPSKNLTIYSAAKAALESMTATDAYHLKQFGIQSILIIPGAVVTKFESKTSFGSRFQKMENPYGDALDIDRKSWKKGMDEGQSPFNVAKTIQKAIEDPNPRLWYITSRKVKDVVRQHYCDISGNVRVPK